MGCACDAAGCVVGVMQTGQTLHTTQGHDIIYPAFNAHTGTATFIFDHVKRRGEEEAMALSIEVRNLKRVSVVSIRGRVDSSNAQELQQAFDQLMDEGQFHLLADLDGLEYISSAGLHILISTLKACRRYNRGDLRLCNLVPRIAEVLDLAGMTPLFQVFNDAVAAVGSF